MENYIFVGCDSHEKTLVNKIAVNREAAETKRIGAHREGRQKLIAYLKQRSQEVGGAKVIVAYEASLHGFHFCDELKLAGMECHVLAPSKIERSTKQKRQKNDDRDADHLLDIVRSHYLAGTGMPAVWVPDQQTRDDREPIRAREDLTEKQSKVKTQIQMLLKRQDLEKPPGIGKAWTKRYGQWLQGLSEDGAGGASGMRTALRSLLRQLDFLEKEIQQLDQALKDLAQTPRRKPIIEELMKQKGVGLIVASKYATAISDFTRFRRGRQVGAFFGLTPTSHESGERPDRKGHITREGSPSVRKVLCQAAWSRVQHDKHEREFYLRLVAKNPKKKKIALVACMRRLAVRLWHVGLQAQLKMETTS